MMSRSVYFSIFFSFLIFLLCLLNFISCLIFYLILSFKYLISFSHLMHLILIYFPKGGRLTDPSPEPGCTSGMAVDWLRQQQHILSKVLHGVFHHSLSATAIPYSRTYRCGVGLYRTYQVYRRVPGKGCDVLRRTCRGEGNAWHHSGYRERD